MNEEHLVLEDHPVVANALNAITLAFGGVDYENPRAGLYTIEGWDRLFEGFNGDDLGIGDRPVESLFNQSVSSSSAPGRTEMFLQAAEGVLFGGEFFIPPEFEADEVPCSLQLTICRDTPANRTRIINALSEHFLEGIQEQIDVLRDHAPHLVSRVMSVDVPAAMAPRSEPERCPVFD